MISPGANRSAGTPGAVTSYPRTYSRASGTTFTHGGRGARGGGPGRGGLRGGRAEGLAERPGDQRHGGSSSAGGFDVFFFRGTPIGGFGRAVSAATLR